jgi:hypothetical protein
MHIYIYTYIHIYIYTYIHTYIYILTPARYPNSGDSRDSPGGTKEVPKSHPAGAQKAPRDTRELTRRPDRSGRQNHKKPFSFTTKTT